jgi:hypothetical protein
MAREPMRRVLRRKVKRALRLMRPGSYNKHRVNIAMIHPGRCGSTVLAKMLSATIDVYWIGELYARFFREWEEQGFNVQNPSSLGDDPLLLVRDKMESRPADVFGFEFKPFHNVLFDMPMCKYLDGLDDLGFKHYVVLQRKNRLRAIVSSVAAHRPGGSYHLAKGKAVMRQSIHLDPASVSIDLDDKPLLSFLEDYDEQFGEVARIMEGRHALSLIYEDDIESNPRYAYEKVCAFIGIVPEDDIFPELRKTNPFPLSVLIDNYQEVAECLQGTRFAWMLDA